MFHDINLPPHILLSFFVLNFDIDINLQTELLRFSVSVFWRVIWNPLFQAPDLSSILSLIVAFGLLHNWACFHHAHDSDAVINHWRVCFFPFLQGANGGSSQLHKKLQFWWILDLHKRIAFNFEFDLFKC